jgi:hypothetical protein
MQAIADTVAQVQRRAAEAAVARLGTDRNNRRLGRDEKPARQDTRTKEQKKMDAAILNNSRAVQLSENRTKEDVIKAVQVAYAAGRNQLTIAEQNAVALVAWNMGLDPSPGVGHLYAWKEGEGDKQKFYVQIGYQGWIFKAQQKYQFVYDTREMSDKERDAHGLQPGDVGAICELYEVERAAQWRTMGMEPRPIKGYGVWRKNLNYKNASWSAKEDNVPNGRSPLWVAEKRAVTDAMKHLGLGFGPMIVQPVPGMEYDADSETYVTTTLDEAGEEVTYQVPADFEEGVIEITTTTVLDEAAGDTTGKPKSAKELQALWDYWLTDRQPIETPISDVLKQFTTCDYAFATRFAKTISGVKALTDITSHQKAALVAVAAFNLGQQQLGGYIHWHDSQKYGDAPLEDKAL